LLQVKEAQAVLMQQVSEAQDKLKSAAGLEVSVSV